MICCLGSTGLFGQDLDNIQIHGFVTQSFLYTTHNNYLTMKSSSGSFQWTEGAVSLNDSVSDNMRVGIQLHMYQMGQIGGPNVLVDWASGDYKLNDRVGVRGGKIKIPMGLFNDSQDVDSLFLWTLLPQSNYPDDNRDFNLAALGGEFYGWLPVSKGGKIQYRAFVGESRLDTHGGYIHTLADYGFTFPDAPSGKVFGGDLRWATPLHGLTLGSSVQSQSLNGVGPEGSLHVPPVFLAAYYGEWTKGKWYLAAEYWRVPFVATIRTGPDSATLSVDQRSWYPMVSYQLTRKMQVGTYYSHYINKAGDTSQPFNYSKDWALSVRYNFNTNFYAKVEEHFVHGTGIGYYSATNPDGLKDNSAMLAARIGFAF
jgi:hypothetical protein